MGTHHVKNADLRNEIIKCKENDELSKEAIEMLMLMAKKFSTKLNYIYAEDREDCIAFAILDCYQYWRGYDPKKSQNAFAYFTQIIKNGFAKGWRKLYGNFPKSKKVSTSSNKIYNI
jgi:hypothetical protein